MFKRASDETDSLPARSQDLKLIQEMRSSAPWPAIAAGRYGASGVQTLRSSKLHPCAIKTLYFGALSRDNDVTDDNNGKHMIQHIIINNIPRRSLSRRSI
jgi:hypothetical protein